MNIIIDRIENNIAVAEMESGKMIQIPGELLPEGAREGTCLSITINKEETAKRQKRVSDKMKSLFE